MRRRICLLNDLSEFKRGYPFHGKEDPDHADFVMFALIKTKMHTRSMKHFFEKKMDPAFQDWFERMFELCKYKGHNKIMYIHN